MIPVPIRDNLESRVLPLLTWTLIGLNVVIYLWDRSFSLLGSAAQFPDLAMRPSEITLILMGQGNPAEAAKIFTSLFLHGDLSHLVMNMIFLQAFGPTVERTLGGWRFALYYLLWGVAAACAHTLVWPHSDSYLLGASGAIGGVMGMYFLLYPTHRIEIMILPIFWTTFFVPAWILLGLWFVLQILVPQAGVANWAHVGGFAAGMLSVLVYGGREKALAILNPSLKPTEAAQQP